MKGFFVLFLLVFLFISPMVGAVELPSPSLEGEVDLEKVISNRRSIREFSDEPLTLNQISQLLWAAQGITDPDNNFRSAPSAGALYPMEVFLILGNAEELDAGVYRYKPEDHSLEIVKEGDIRGDLRRASLGQRAIEQAPINIVITAEYTRTTGHYGARGERYVHMEAGHIGQNIYLQAAALGLGTVAIGAFNDGDVASLLDIEYNPLYIFPVGYSQEFND